MCLLLFDPSIRVYYLRGVAYQSGARGIYKNDFIKKGISRTFTLKIGIIHFKACLFATCKLFYRLTSKSDLSSTTKCDQIHITHTYKFGRT
jgi:hypothetical protein